MSRVRHRRPLLQLHSNWQAAFLGQRRQAEASRMPVLVIRRLVRQERAPADRLRGGRKLREIDVSGHSSRCRGTAAAGSGGRRAGAPEDQGGQRPHFQGVSGLFWGPTFRQLRESPRPRPLGFGFGTAIAWAVSRISLLWLIPTWPRYRTATSRIWSLEECIFEPISIFNISRSDYRSHITYPELS